MNLAAGFLKHSTMILSFVLAAAAAPAFGQSVRHLTVAQPGGMPAMPVMTGIEKLTNGVRLTWDGPPGYYQVVRRALGETKWTGVGPRTNFSGSAIVPMNGGNFFFNVSGPAPVFAGSQSCIECHGTVHNTEVHTAHAEAFETLRKVNQHQNASCLPCHTVGHGKPTGFISETRTPRLAGVQCENCHGPAALHAANPEDIIMRPRVETAAAMCGGCHNGSHHPTYDEWNSSGHAIVSEDMNPAGRIDSCGRCHSGTARLSLLKGQTPVPGDANMGLSCVVCHEPHRTNSHPAQLRNPLSSTNDYFITTSVPFANQYDANVNLCAQCHNHRGAAWTSSSRPPHHSPQYNMLIGSVGVLVDGTVPSDPGGHALLIEKQCVACHMQSAEADGPHSADTGHTFRVERFDACVSCHALPELLTTFTASAVGTQIQQVKSLLDLWALTRAPQNLRTVYGARAWEYSSAGELSGGGSGPSSSEQALIPANIRKARFNLYIVYHDGSYGVHNGPHTITLLEAARTMIEAELGL